MSHTDYESAAQARKAANVQRAILRQALTEELNGYRQRGMTGRAGQVQAQIDALPAIEPEPVTEPDEVTDDPTGKPSAAAALAQAEDEPTVAPRTKRAR